MGQLEWRLWLVGAATFLLGNASGTASSSHSLLHFRHALLLEGQPQFVEVTYLDGQPIQRYDSNTERMRSLTPWINQTLDEGYWQRESFMGYITYELHFRQKLEELSLPQKHNQSEEVQFTVEEETGATQLPLSDVLISQQENGSLETTVNYVQFTVEEETTATQLPLSDVLISQEEDGSLETTVNSHTLQCIEGCKLTADGDEIEIHQDAVDGEEMKGEEFHWKRIYWQGNCIMWLKRYLNWKPQSKGPSAEATAHVLNVNDTLLNCSICNFYPEDIYATWKKDGEFLDLETIRGDTIRHWDGTYCTSISIEINPTEEYRYHCYVDHEGLTEALSVKVIIPTEEKFQPLLILWCVLAVLGILLFLITGILCYKKRRHDYRPAAKSDLNSSLDKAEKGPRKEIEGVPPLSNASGEVRTEDNPTSQGIREEKTAS